ncbi:MAG: TetR/AcrR family transcriptional regulator, regulator of autoinduction and epiphytic fitness, partial [Actinomycetota bacterium]|nr:TetR/AcrR family transcriptional regulator, regulator of autoinduction and epiphytic fitness [Actinomycetota bacterium]
TPARRAALVQEPFSAQLRASRDRMLALARAEVHHVFGAELALLDEPEADDVAAAVDAASSWGAWDALRHASGLSPTSATRVLARLVASALGQPELSLSTSTSTST